MASVIILVYPMLFRKVGGQIYLDSTNQKTGHEKNFSSIGQEMADMLPVTIKAGYRGS